MANFVYTRAARDIMKGDIDFDVDTFRVELVMTNTTCDTEEDAANLGAFSTIDRHDGANYVQKTLAAQAVNEDTTNDRAEFDDTADITWTSLGAGTRAIAGAILYKFVTDDAGSTPIAWIDTPSFANSNGGDYTIQWNAEGIVQGQC